MFPSLLRTNTINTTVALQFIHPNFQLRAFLIILLSLSFFLSFVCVCMCVCACARACMRVLSCFQRQKQQEQKKEMKQAYQQQYILLCFFRYLVQTEEGRKDKVHDHLSLNDIFL